MTPQSRTGHDGPYDAPVRITGGTVLPAWIDYNGHMNVAYYTLALDAAIDEFLEHTLGVGVTFTEAAGQGPYALQAAYHYLGELLEGEAFDVTVRMHDHDAKRMHLFVEMFAASGAPAATLEGLLMNVDHKTRRGAAYPDWAQTRMARMLADHAVLPTAPQIGAPIGIRRA